jgi:N-acetylmuramoyl-L-alanine amidase
VTLKNRGRIANQAGGKLFISIHANAARNRTATGTETYFLGLHKTAAARQVMERENEVVKLESNPEAYEGLDEQALIVQTLTQSAYMRKSEELASFIQDQFTNRVGRKNRGVKQAGFYVLWNASMPSILVELGFVTNPTEAAFLNSEAGQEYLASAIFRAVRDYKIQYEKGLNVVSQ